MVRPGPGEQRGNDPASPIPPAAGRATVTPRSIGHRARAARDAIRARPGGHRAYRIAVAVVGGSIVIIGLVLVPFPGPGWLVVLIGLAVLASEFTWAERLQQFVRRQLRGWVSWLGRQPWPVRALTGWPRSRWCWRCWWRR
jgi:uncharacterized protein (TIGR02611 family)